MMDRLKRPASSLPIALPARPRFEQIYSDHFAYVWHTLRRLGVLLSEREDLAHDVFVVVHRRQSDYDPTRPLRPWLFGITYRVASEHHRRRPRHEQEADPDDLIDPERSPERIAASNEARRQVTMALERLPLEQRAVLVLHDIDGIAAPEIARALELPLNTVYSRLRLARAKFVDAIAAEEGDSR